MTQAYQDLLEAALAPTRINVGPAVGATPRGVAPAEAAYQRALIVWNRALVRMVVRELRPVLATATDAPRRDADIDVNKLLEALANIRRRLPELAARALPSINRALERLNRDNLRDVRRVLPISIADQGPEVAGTLANWRTENVRLVTTIGPRLLDDLQDLLVTAATTGMRVETLRKRIQERFSVSESRAKLIAVDQTLKGNSALTQARHRQAGVTSYIWTTSRDERVRPEHRALDRQEFRWDDPPPPGHPGQDFNCRCVARPVIR